ncbi:ABC transporter permease [Blastococcus sp. TF02A-26]|uniref:ABC transporter permease n=1 Tax=Blastococcus sp. TF02A-26 TaxID=2250577 RepID=UPI000DE871AF|nr:ABC transporter permease [Blastococcus sp. TF02A-26]RBY84724.1 ABC transporter permease [Blastococcus sp. TF02A-26]
MSTQTTPTPTAVPSASRAPVPGPTLLRLTQVELRKSADTRAGFWLLLVVALTSPAVAVLQMLFAEEEDKTFSMFLANTQLPVALLLPVLGILLVTSEWSQRTAITTFALVPDRSRVLGAKVLAATVLGVLGVLATVLAAALGSLLTPVLTSDGTDWTVSGAQVGQVVVVQVLGILIGVAFGMLLLSSPLAIVLYFVAPTVVTIVSNLVEALTWMRDWLDLTTTTAPMYLGELDGQGWLQVATSVGLWGVLPMVAGWLRIERSEIA